MNAASKESVQQNVTQVITAFLAEIGIPVEYRSIEHETFLPGLSIEKGTIVVDEEKLKYPGDLLHEAGHLALIPPGERNEANGDVGNDPAIEMTAIAWSYAAAVHLNLPPEVVFHPDGYKGGSNAIIENFTNGNYIGVPLLDWMGMASAKTTDEDESVMPYPHMKRWLR